MTSAERPRRWRRTPALRRLFRETRLHPAELIAPLFVEAGTGIRTPLPSLPGQHRWSPDTVGEEAKRLEALGVGGVILFGIPTTKDAAGSSGWDPKGPVPRALQAIERAAPRLVRMADVCLTSSRSELRATAANSCKPSTRAAMRSTSGRPRRSRARPFVWTRRGAPRPVCDLGPRPDCS